MITLPLNIRRLGLDPIARTVFAMRITVTALQGTWPKKHPDWQLMAKAICSSNLSKSGLEVRRKKTQFLADHKVGAEACGFLLVSQLHAVLLKPGTNTALAILLDTATAFVREHRQGENRMAEWDDWLKAYAEVTIREMVVRKAAPTFFP